MARGSSDAQILSNKRIEQRSRQDASVTDLVPDISRADHYSLSGIKAALTISAPIGNPKDNDRLIFRLHSDGISHALTWNAVYRSQAALSPPATVAATGFRLVEFLYNEPDKTWDLVAALDF